MKYYVFESDLGWVGIAFSLKGLWRLVFAYPSPDEAERALGIGEGWVLESENGFTGELKRYLSGERVKLDLPVDWSWATLFQRMVLAEVKQIPYGMKESYGSIAAKLDKPGAARAVGGALARNQVPLVIPCHRVLAAGKSLGGFSSRNGLHDKIALLKMEGALSDV